MKCSECGAEIEEDQGWVWVDLETWRVTSDPVCGRCAVAGDFTR
jgi:hypothetical protein